MLLLEIANFMLELYTSKHQKLTFSKLQTSKKQHSKHNRTVNP